jgi:PAS domain S-box-containing protein
MVGFEYTGPARHVKGFVSLWPTLARSRGLILDRMELPDPPTPARHQPGEALHQSEELFRLLVDSVKEYAIFLLDPTGHVATWNMGAERLKGYSAADIIGQHFSSFYPPEVPRDTIDDELVIAVREGVFRTEGWRLRKDGTQFWADVTITPVHDSRGSLVGFAKVTRDLTARKRADDEREELARAQAARAEAERANQLKDAFLATLSHELRTPLNAIVGWAHLLQGKQLEPDVRKAIEVIARNAAAQTQLISDILDISRISSGRVQLRVQRVELPAVIEAALDVVRPAADAKGIRLMPLIGDAAPVWGDPDRLQQIVWNLLSNAVKFTVRNGQVQVRLRRSNSNVEIVVQDTGAGIAPEFLGHVFEPFRQADATPTRVHGGLGLGLAIVRHLTELHGGRVSASSEGLGRGATFVVELPALPMADSRAPGRDERAAGPQPNLRGVRVLLVEDDEDSRDLLEAMLAGTGAAVRTTASAVEATDVLREWRPEVLVSDIEMPEQSGYDFIRTVRDLPAEQGGLTPAVALTAYARTEDRVRALTTGFQIHLSKPVHPEELVAAVATLTGRSRA